MENYLAKAIVDACFHIHVKLGPGLFESLYEEVLHYELCKQGFLVKRQHPIPVIWDDTEMDLGFRADLIVEDLVLIELKSVKALDPVHK